MDEASVIKKYLITASDGKNYAANHNNLQMIIAVGFKVNSERAVQFRKWVNGIAKEYNVIAKRSLVVLPWISYAPLSDEPSVEAPEEFDPGAFGNPIFRMYPGEQICDRILEGWNPSVQNQAK